MKKAIFFPPSCSNVKENEFESCRGEGRSVINMAFGFALLGYECYIINNWNISSPKKIWDNVYINNHPDVNEIYDIAISYDNLPIINQANYKHKIVMNYAHTDEVLKKINENNLDVILTCPIPSIMHDSSTFQYKNSRYLPPVSPIPSVNIGFIPYKFEPKLPELKVYVYHSSWSGSSGSNFHWGRKQLLILEFLKSKGYKLNLFIHVENEETSKNCPFGIKDSNVNDIHYIYNDKVRYDDIIKMLKSVDLCISGGGIDYIGTCVCDIISLGRPLIYVVDGVPNNEFIFNGLYNCPKYLIISQEPDDISQQKLESIITSLEESYNCYRDTLKDLDFNNWKEYVTKFLEQEKINI